MVGSELLEIVVAQTVRAAVSDIDHKDVSAVSEDTREGGAHARSGRSSENLCINLLTPFLQSHHYGAIVKVWCKAVKEFLKRLRSHCRGFLTPLVAAHTVGHDGREALIVTQLEGYLHRVITKLLSEDESHVFIVGANASHVAYRIYSYFHSYSALKS